MRQFKITVLHRSTAVCTAVQHSSTAVCIQ